MIKQTHAKPIHPRAYGTCRLLARALRSAFACLMAFGALVSLPGLLSAAEAVDLSGLVRGKSVSSPQSSPVGGANALGEPTVLTAEAAFPVRFTPAGPGLVRVSFDIQPGYYLYRDKFAVASITDGVSVALRGLPEGAERDDAVFGLVPVFTEPVEFELTGPADRDVEVELRYQGCAEVGICYQPQKTRLLLTGNPSTR